MNPGRGLLLSLLAALLAVVGSAQAVSTPTGLAAKTAVGPSTPLASALVRPDPLRIGITPRLAAHRYDQIAVATGVAAKAVRPTVSDTRLGRALADDYRGGPNPIGDGSALDAARHTVTTGELVGGSTHLEKVVEMRDRYARILRRGGLSPADEAVARSRYGAYRNFAQEHNLDAMMKARGLR